VRIVLGVEDWEHTLHISVGELVRRLTRRFPNMIVDQEKGDARVQERLQHLIDLDAPSVILESHRSYFGDTIFVSISEVHWKGATATCYLTSINPPLGDTFSFEVTGADPTSINLMKRDLAMALDMVCYDEDAA
jgi:hypothetical protein